MIYRRTRNNSVGRNHVEIFVRPMRYKGCHQAHNAKVVICALFTTPNSLKLQERRKAFLPIRKVRAISQSVLALTAAKSPQRLTRHLATRPAVSFIGGFRTTAPVQAASSRSAVIRNPSQERKRDRRYSISLSARSINAGDRDLEASKAIEPRLVGR